MIKAIRSVLPLLAILLPLSVMTSCGGCGGSTASVEGPKKPGGMIAIPTANLSFQMGQAGIAEPVHEVSFASEFWIDSTEVTQEDYLRTMGVNPSVLAGDWLLPVENVTWYDAVLYCNARSKRDGLDTVYQFSSVTGTAGNGATNLAGLSTDYGKKGYRLPTEAEWEYAARAGTGTVYYWGDTLDAEYAWLPGEAGVQTHLVAQKKPNAWGLYDMAGNVFEWTGDWYGDYPSEARVDPKGPDAGMLRVVRGGSWGSNAEYLSSARRGTSPNDFRGDRFGFRCVLPK